MLGFYTVKPEDSYGVMHGPVAIEALAPYQARGTLLVVRPPPDSTTSSSGLRAKIQAAAERVVNVAIVLWLESITSRHAAEYAAKLRSLGVCGIIWNREPAGQVLRDQLTDREAWPEYVLLWLRWRGFRPSSQAERLLEQLARYGPDYRTFADLAAHCGLSQRQCRRILDRDSLGSAASWHSVLRLVGIAQEIQRHPTAPIGEIAFRFGYSGAAALSDRMNDVIGARPQFIRHHLGWPWMLADGLRRAGIM